jgi:hypothetical protein
MFCHVMTIHSPVTGAVYLAQFCAEIRPGPVTDGLTAGGDGAAVCEWCPSVANAEAVRSIMESDSVRRSIWHITA